MNQNLKEKFYLDKIFTLEYYYTFILLYYFIDISQCPINLGFRVTSGKKMVSRSASNHMDSKANLLTNHKPVYGLVSTLEGGICHTCLFLLGQRQDPSKR